MGDTKLTRIEIQIPQQEERQPKFQFIKVKDGMVAVVAETTQDHIAAFRNVTEELDEHYWAQAAVAASLSKKYGMGDPGKGEMQKLAEAVELSSNYLYRMARTYRTFTESFPRESKLYFKHHVIAAGYTNPSEALAVAVERGMPCGALEEWVSDQNRKKAKRASRKAVEEVRTQFLDHLEHVESVIQDDFIKFCPSKDFARRVYEKGWLAEIKSELRQYNRKLNEDIVRAAIDDDGAVTVGDIREVTGLPLSDIEGLVGQFVANGEYEFVPQGGQTDVARGSARMVLHKVGTPFGNVSLPAAQSRYSN